MAKGDYYFPLYYKRLLTSTIGWKDDEFGAYVRLLIHQFDNGSIPSDMNEIIRIAPSAKKHWKLLSKKFHDDGNGGLVNNVMKEVYERIQDKKETSKANGKAGGRPPGVKYGEIRVYLIECYDENERFFKVGTTTKTINARFPSSAMPYSYQVITDVIVGQNKGIEIEQIVLNQCERHLPMKQFGGYGECLKMENSVVELLRKLITQKNPTGSQTVSEKNLIPITNNQETITNNRETRHSTKIFDGETALLENMIEMERICIVTGKSLNQAKESLHKYHLYLQEKEQYPKSRTAIFAGFEKWLMNEKNISSQQTINGSRPTGIIV